MTDHDIEDEAWPDPMLLAKERVDAIVRARGFRIFHSELDGGSAFVEYRREGLRLRLVYEGEAKVLWVEQARDTGAEVVSRWVDIEWAVAGQRLPLDTETDEARLGRLSAALVRFLELASASGPA